MVSIISDLDPLKSWNVLRHNDVFLEHSLEMLPRVRSCVSGRIAVLFGRVIIWQWCYLAEVLFGRITIWQTSSVLPSASQQLTTLHMSVLSPSVRQDASDLSGSIQRTPVTVMLEHSSERGFVPSVCVDGMRYSTTTTNPVTMRTSEELLLRLLLHGQSVCVAGQLGPGPGEMSHTLSGFWDRTGQDRTGQDTSGLNRRREGAGSALQTTRLWSRRTHHVFVLQSGLPPQYDGGRRAPDHSREDHH
ncbi:hypothetical protein QTP70_012621 [Hemibagrus guttatus]|uniref:Uncharacterized protein n=1 Tax=Hemibagrus guttatus TaxID=175788 RepID=A0AAE0USK5_9TELE|nr:hypothetical protein QTP70_012621 [Hemibagrus guttatus]